MQVEIAAMYIKKMPVSEKHLLYWYVALAFAILIFVLIVCMTREPQAPGFYDCAGKVAHGWTFLAVHALVLLIFIDHKDRDDISFSVLANTFARMLILGAALLFILAEYQLVVLPAILFVTIPLMAVIYIGDQKKKPNKQITCCDCCQ